MSNVTPIQHAMIAELAEYIDPINLSPVGDFGVRVGNHYAFGFTIPGTWDGTTLTAGIEYHLSPDGPEGPVGVSPAAEWLGAG